MFTNVNDNNTTNSQDNEFTESGFTTTKQVLVNMRPVNLLISHE